ncbi:uncharacterized protein [Anas platyrhynchos]|uniref:uncharacterized protein isoform X1 n=1 Tax=Anas platyrhynchos TaxID=8839 RepID=UPI003AF312B3
MGICYLVSLSGWEMTMRMKAGPGLGNAQDGQEAVWKRGGHGKCCVGGQACWGWPSLALGSLLGSKACSPPQDVGEGLVSRWDGTAVARVPQATAPLSSHHGRSSSRLPLLPGLRPCWRAQRPRAQPSALFPTEGFPRRLLRLAQTQNSPFVVSAVPPTVAAWLLPSLPGATALPLQPLQVPTLPSALPQATVWHVVPGVQGQVLQLPAGVQLPPGGHLPAQGHHLQLGQLPAVGQLPAGGQLPAVGQNLQLVQLPTMGHQLQLVQLPAVGQLPHTAPPCAPVHQWGQPMVTGTLVPHHALGLGPRAVLHGELLHPAGTCLLQAPAQRNPPPPLVPGPPLRGQALPTPRTLSSSRGQLPEPCLHAVGLSEDQGPPLPGPTPPEPAQAPRTASTQTATPDAATAPQVPEEPPQLPELGPDALAEAFPELAGDSQQLQHVQDELLAHLDIPIPDMEELLSWLDAVEPQDAFPDLPSSPALSRFLSQLPDLCEDIEEPSTQGLEATGALGEVPSSPGVRPEKLEGGLSLQSPVVPAVSPPLSPAASPLPSALRSPLPSPPLSPPRSLPDTQVLSALRRALPQPPQRSLKTRPNPKVPSALSRAQPKSPPSSPKKRPNPKGRSDHRRPLPKRPLGPLKSPLAAPASTGTERGAKRPAPSSTPGTAQSCQHRRPTTENPPRKERKMLLGQAGQGRKRPCQGKTRGSSTVAGSSREAGSSGQQLAINSTTAPVKRARSPGAAGGQGAAAPAPRRARLLPETPSGEPRAVRPQDRLCPQASGAKTLEESVPITPQQRPERERLKKLAQEERQRAAHQMKIGPVQFFVQRQKDHARAYSYGYP